MLHSGSGQIAVSETRKTVKERPDLAVHDCLCALISNDQVTLLFDAIQSF